MNDPIICPVCGREMVLCGSQWECFHDIEKSGAFFGPRKDTSGDLVRAQIAAMEKRIRDTHPTGETLGEKDAAVEACGTCVFKSPVTHRCQSLMSQWKHYAMPDDGTCQCWADRVAPKAFCDPDKAPNATPTCGQCAWKGYEISVRCKKEENGLYNPQIKISQFNCDSASCTRPWVELDTPACPAFVQAERSEK